MDENQCIHVVNSLPVAIFAPPNCSGDDLNEYYWLGAQKIHACVWSADKQSVPKIRAVDVSS